MTTNQECLCKFCGEKFNTTTDLKVHVKNGVECRKLKGVLFVCLRCDDFHTTNFDTLQLHLDGCREVGLCKFDVIEAQRKKIEELTRQVNAQNTPTKTKKTRTPPKKTKPRDRTNSIKKKRDVEPDIVDSTFGKIEEAVDPVEYINNLYLAIIPVTRYTRHLKKIKRERRVIFEKGDIVDYKTLLSKNLVCLLDVLTKKEMDEKKQRKIILDHFTPIDLRLLRYDGYENLSPDGSMLQELEFILSGRDKPVNFSMDIANMVYNYSICVLPVKTAMKTLLVTANPSYVYSGKRKSDPYQFYYRDREEQGVTYWTMDCRMIDFFNTVRESIIPYLIKVFRKNYAKVFSDNVYRECFFENMSGLEGECKQILQNLLFMSLHKKFLKMMQRLVMENNCKNMKTTDKLNLKHDDPIPEDVLEDTQEYNCKKLFDDISPFHLTKLVNSIGFY